MRLPVMPELKDNPVAREYARIALHQQNLGKDAWIRRK
jgi:hypothetical protein